MLQAEGIKKSFGSNQILRGVDLEVNKGDVVVILGPSGAGKTTLLRCLNFLEKPDDGKLRIDDLIVDARSSKREIVEYRRKTAMVFQQYNLFKNKTALQNVMEGLVQVQRKQKDEAEMIAKEYLDKVGLHNKYDAYPASLSGGQQQRVGIARALALKPEVILFDEPTSALDPELVGEVLSVMRSIAEIGITMVVVTHEIQFAMDIATKVVVMADGEVVEQGNAKDIFQNAKEERTRQFLKKIIPEYSYVI
ncbi:MAG: amino acid ABC transporter ATP-binding protein [Lachnospiraceae bacterium]|nr:amino acid ABC transporter ATP-binding protein [Lachnospiraceae bacterium]